MMTKKIDEKKVRSAEVNVVVGEVGGVAGGDAGGDVGGQVAGALRAMEGCLGELETVWLAGGEKRFLAGDTISVGPTLLSSPLNTLLLDHLSTSSLTSP